MENYLELLMIQQKELEVQAVSIDNKTYSGYIMGVYLDDRKFIMYDTNIKRYVTFDFEEVNDLQIL